MNQGRWRLVEDLFHAVLERPPESRRSFLEAACAGDAELRQQVERLVSNDEQAGSFLERPVLAGAPATQAARTSLVGREYGPYRILSLLGAGGMGEVYRAHDGRLSRDVAIKTVPPEFARDPTRLARLRREARVLASLNHPHIATIYGLEQSGDADYLVLELVEGETPRGPLPLPAAVDIACQVADALQAAHDHGIVHRDLKPANLKVTPQGVVKVLDFGLAKAIWGTEGHPDPASAAPVARDGTASGHVLGTPGYMSPEQARGAEVDQRTDVWAFGCLLYELLSGTRAFPCDTVWDATAAVLERDPDWQALPEGTPAGVRDLLRQCLQKDVNLRLKSIAGARAILEEERGARTRPRPPAGAIRSLAVLPLANLSGDPGQEYFSDGMTEALIAELAQVHALRVISRTSAMHYKGTTKTVPEIGRELDVDAVVEGSVMRSGDGVRITAQLIHAASDRHVWAQSYERDLRDILQLQGDVARAIADEIRVTLTPEERARLSRARPVNVEAHEAYIRGHYHWGRVHPARSIEHFQRAIAIDPDYAQAYAGIADAQCMLFGAAMEAVPPSEVAPLARAAALKALELDESLAEPHVTLARVLFWHDRDAVGAERELRRAIQLNPNCAMAHFVCGMQLADLGRKEEGIAEYRLALRLDPVSTWNGAIAGLYFWQLGLEAEGKQQLQKALELEPGFFLAWSLLAFVHCREGRFTEALAAAQEGIRLVGGLPLAQGMAAYFLGMAGRRSEALATLDSLEGLSRERYVPALARAWCYLGLGDHERVIQWLEIGYAQRDSGLPHIGVWREFEPLHSDPRFQDLLRRLGVRP